ncbi:tetratricopeptide repeat protein [Halopseudomonas sabulinigri]|uniref:Proteolytic complex protein LbcA n=1 Tax=Halopseudomonas sabulinigri TaxID=472181 RepID=A0ABP9ZTN9_9GAMM
MKASFTPPPLLLLMGGLLLGGCTALSKPEPAPQPPAQVVEAPAEPIEYGQFRQDTLFDLLTAEIAGQRNRFDIALDNYLHQARETRDPGVTERAMRVAEFLGAEEPALDMAQLWVELDGSNPEALRSAAIHLARTGQHEQAMDMMQRALDLHGETHFDFLALAAAESDAPTREALLESLTQMLGRHPGNTQLVFAKALLLQQAGREDEALSLLENHRGTDAAPAAILLHSRLVVEQDPDRAEQILYSGLESFPDDTRMRLLLARMLVTSGDYRAASTQYAKLVQDNPEDPDLRLSLGLIYLELDQPTEAVEQLQQVLLVSPDNNTARYHLGNAQLAAGQPEAALTTWQQIDSGNELLTSRLQISQLLVRQGQLDELASQLQQDREDYPQHALTFYQIEIEALSGQPEKAMQSTNAALQAYPLESSLLYTRAMLHDQLGNPAGTEEDLRTILAREPDNAMALNALGYTLADRNERLDEALSMLQRAAALEPDDPAVRDSLGWVYYRLGDLERAEQLLRGAFAEFPDQEVAAHLGEVLWRQGNKKEARKVWKQGLEQSPDSELIPATRNRLEAE